MIICFDKTKLLPGGALYNRINVGYIILLIVIGVKICGSKVCICQEAEKHKTSATQD
jgi:hypothetical protein